VILPSSMWPCHVLRIAKVDLRAGRAGRTNATGRIAAGGRGLGALADQVEAKSGLRLGLSSSTSRPLTIADRTDEIMTDPRTEQRCQFSASGGTGVEVQTSDFLKAARFQRESRMAFGFDTLRKP